MEPSGWPKYTSCALLTSGNIRCWGGAALGYPAPEEYIGDDETPASAGDVNVGGTVTALALGLQHTCALLSTRAVRCWGTGVSHQLGYANIGNLVEANTGGDVPVGGDVIQLAAGQNHNCAVLTSGAVRCWGTNDFGQLGYARVGNISIFETPATPYAAGAPPTKASSATASPWSATSATPKPPPAWATCLFGDAKKRPTPLGQSPDDEELAQIFARP
ncbi:MAG TPA: hypothetical protein VIW29_01255 [Polyangiaceae bacterium]